MATLTHVVRLPKPSPGTYEDDFAVPRSGWCREQYGDPCLNSSYDFVWHTLKMSRMNTDGVWAYLDGAWMFKDKSDAFAFKMRWWGDEEIHLDRL
ncbi:MAG: hypothetical protein EOP83_26020 [Verrucomicrobiaceae bacterium]|nr:MAG: hypothetical protein EOP83_26020 [Verrucomicrobiaceae bacterium]